MSDVYILRNALKDLTRPKKLVAALLLMLLPALMVLIQKSFAPTFSPDDAYSMYAANLVFGFVLVIMAVVYGTGVIAQEIEQKTIVYLLTRPVPRWRILLNKLVAVVIGTTAVVWLSAILLALVTYGPKGLIQSRLPVDLAILPIGALAYCALFLLAAVQFNRALIIGLVFAFGWETWVPYMPGNFNKLSLMTYLRILAPHADNAAPVTISVAMAWVVLFSVIVFGLAAACFVFSTREYAPREDAE